MSFFGQIFGILRKVFLHENFPFQKKIAKNHHNCLQYERALLSYFEHCQILLNILMDSLHLSNITNLETTVTLLPCQFQQMSIKQLILKLSIQQIEHFKRQYFPFTNYHYLNFFENSIFLIRYAVKKVTASHSIPSHYTTYAIKFILSSKPIPHPFYNIIFQLFIQLYFWKLNFMLFRKV